MVGFAGKVVGVMSGFYLILHSDKNIQRINIFKDIFSR